MKELKEPISVVCAKNIAIKMMNRLVEKWKCVVIEPNISTTEQITKKVMSRKQSEPLLFIAPSGENGMMEKDAPILSSPNNLRRHTLGQQHLLKHQKQRLLSQQQCSQTFRYFIS